MPRIRTVRHALAGWVPAALVCMPLVACAVHAHPASRAHHAVRVTVAPGHAHSAHCGHYRYCGHWYHLRGHRHGPRCGHLFVGAVWVLRR